MKSKHIIIIMILLIVTICTISTSIALAEPGDATNDIINLYPHIVTAINGLYDMDINIYGYTIDQEGLIIPYYGHIKVNGTQVTINNQTGDAQLLSDYLITTDTERHILGISANIESVKEYINCVRMVDTNDTYYTFENAITTQEINVNKTVLIFNSIQGVGVSTNQKIKGQGLEIGNKNYNITNTKGFWVTEKNTIYDQYFTKKQLIYDYDGDNLYSNAYASGVEDANNTVTETSESYKKGYEKGYNKGYGDSGNIHFIDVITAVFDVPTQWLTNLLDYDILGFNLLTFFQSIITITIVIAIIKMIL